ncbi:hypothetical protein QQ020_07600 [Fulvivirgaceae bacterium BMA12]|uniref:Chromosome partitioning protein ParB n=1 Tax=Agaribacillus aureus TaxID=3051825 RepID=A0ABT8L517_9BACT|nr:hypothetical protein [Fulvivirgaceae bacterium BMA12]
MRKQYHFQPSKNGFYAWDVDKLIALTKDHPQISVKLDEIKELDENFWFQGPEAKPTCRSLVGHFKQMEVADLKYPIILSQKGRVMDGMHRVCKSLLLGHKEIKAVKFNNDPAPDYEDVFEDDLPY